MLWTPRTATTPRDEANPIPVKNSWISVVTTER